MSIRYKIALLFSLLTMLILTIVGTAVYYFDASEQKRNFNTRLLNRALSTAKLYESSKDSDLSVLRKVDSSVVVTLLYKSVQIFDSTGKAIYSYADKPRDFISVPVETLKSLDSGDRHFFTANKKEAVIIHSQSGNASYFVLVSARNIEGREFLSLLAEILLLAFVVAIVLSFLIGMFFARKIILPIKSITDELKLITSNNLSKRVNITYRKDELGVMIKTINGLLDRLQDSFAIQRRFISNASHELSTPLTSISTQIEVAMQKERSVASYKEILESVHEDILGLQQLTKSLLDIAKIGSQGSIDLEPVRVDELLFRVVSEVQSQHPDYKTILHFDHFPDDEQLLTTFGNSNLLYIAFRNIIENGCKYADNNESVITANFLDSGITIEVSNKGEVLTEAEIQHIFQPFFRTVSASAKPGFGLGLTLTKRIISLHKGSISVKSHFETGTLFTINIPNVLH